jgi:predicted RNA binding protein YcfA (HicA-like mRNA interferase family)
MQIPNRSLSKRGSQGRGFCFRRDKRLTFTTFSDKITPLNWKILEKIFIAAGFQFARQAGSHRSYIKQGIPRPVVIPAYEEVPVSIIKNYLKTADLSLDDFFRLLEKET